MYFYNYPLKKLEKQQGECPPSSEAISEILFSLIQVEATF